MTKDLKIVDEMVGYARQLRLRTKGRRAVHIKLSCLEKHYRDERYRRFVASLFIPLIASSNATMFALPTHDLVLILEYAGLDQIETLLGHARDKFKESQLLRDLDPVQGESDAFVTWFDLEQDYAGFRTYIEALAINVAGGFSGAGTSVIANELNKAEVAAPGGKEQLGSEGSQPKYAASKKMRLVPVSAPEKNVATHTLGPELLQILEKALLTVDVVGLMRKQRVMAILGDGSPRPVMVQRFIPKALVLEKLLGGHVTEGNYRLFGYFADQLAVRALFSLPNMASEKSIASSLRVSCVLACDGLFMQFDGSVGALARSAIILEFGLTDILSNYGDFERARAIVKKLGYRILIRGVDPRILVGLDLRNFGADFIKLRVPKEADSDWLTTDLEPKICQKIIDIGIVRVILDGCETQADIDKGRRLGITLFQGSAAAPITSQ